METEVPILWVDDNTDFVESISKKLDSWLVSGAKDRYTAKIGLFAGSVDEKLHL